MQLHVSCPTILQPSHCTKHLFSTRNNALNPKKNSSKAIKKQLPRLDFNSTKHKKDTPYKNVNLPINHLYSVNKLAHSNKEHTSNYYKEDWISTKNGILIALAHATRDYFSKLCLYGLPPTLKDEDARHIIKSLEKYNNLLTDRLQEAPLQTPFNFKIESFKKLGKLDPKLFQILVLSVDRKIPVYYKPSNLFERYNSFKRGVCLLKASAFNFHEVSYIKPFDPESNKIKLLGFGKDQINTTTCYNFPPRLVLLDGIQDTQNLAGIIRTLYFFQIDGLILPENDTCSLDSLTKVRKDLDEHRDKELVLCQEKGAKSIQRMSAGAYDLYASKIFMTRGSSRFINLTKRQSISAKGEIPWKIVACSPPKEPFQGQRENIKGGFPTFIDIYDKEALESLKAFPLIIVFGHEETGIRNSLQELADINLAIPKFDSLPLNKPNIDSLNLSVSVGVILSHIIEPSKEK